VPLSDLASTGFGPLYGVGPTWEAHFRTTRNEAAVMYFNGPTEAEAFKNALYDAARASGSGDPNPQEPPNPRDDARGDPRLQRLHDLVDDLRPMASADALGRPFGAGYGLEEAVQAVFARLQSPEDARECGRIMAVELIINTHDDQLPQEIMDVMGATPGAARRNGLPVEARVTIEGLAGAAHTFLGQFDGDGSIWELWRNRDDVVSEFLCWHTVARLRLATAGRMPPVERPPA
jgi:hypothetical protein